MLIAVLISGLNTGVKAAPHFFSWMMEKFIAEGREVSLIINKGMKKITFRTQEEPVEINIPGSEEVVNLKEKTEYIVKKGKDYHYELQIFASHDYDQARDLYRKLKDEDFEDLKLIEDRDWYKVRLGHFELRREALPLSTKLDKRGLPNWIVEVEELGSEALGIFDSENNLLVSNREIIVKGKTEINGNIYPGKVSFKKAENGIKAVNNASFSSVVQGITAVELDSNRIESLKTSSGLDQDQIDELIKIHLVTTRSSILHNILNDTDGQLELNTYQGVNKINSRIKNLYNETQMVILNEEKNPAELEFNTSYISPLLNSNYSYREVLTLLNPDSTFLDLSKEINTRMRVEAEVEWGLDYKEIEQLTWWGPRIVSVLELDLTHDDLIIKPVLAENKVPGIKDLSDIVRDNNALAGVNGGYFRYTGRPLGLIINDGQIISEPLKNRTVIAFNQKNEFYIGSLQWSGSLSNDNGQKTAVIKGVNRKPKTDEIVLINKYYGEKAPDIKAGIKELIIKKGEVRKIREGKNGLEADVIPEDGFIIQAHGDGRKDLENFKIGDTVKYKNKFQPDLKHLGVISAVGGGPRLVRDGKIDITSEQEEFQSDITAGRAPRTAVGITADNRLIMVTVDGRQPELSIGMTLEELSQFMINHGVVEAVNLDGGSSARMVVRGYTMSNPDRPREISNAIIIKEDR